MPCGLNDSIANCHGDGTGNGCVWTVANPIPSCNTYAKGFTQCGIAPVLAACADQWTKPLDPGKTCAQTFCKEGTYQNCGVYLGTCNVTQPPG